MHQPHHQPEMTPTPQEHIPPTLVVLDVLKGLGIARCLHVAVHLGLVNRLRDGPKSVEELAQATTTHAPSLYRLLRCLASVGLFAETEPGFFVSGVVASALRQDRPDSIYHLAKWIAQGPDWKLWEHLEYSIRTGKPAMEEVYGMDLWKYLTTHPVESELYDTAMSSFSVLADTPVAQAYDFSSFGTLVDIGGGQGHLLMSILSAYPTVKGVLFDRPSVIKRARPEIDPVLQGRMHLVAGDFFTAVPAGADAYLLKHVLHDWNDEDALRILQTCRQAMKARQRAGLGLPPDPDVRPSALCTWPSCQRRGRAGMRRAHLTRTSCGTPTPRPPVRSCPPGSMNCPGSRRCT